MSASVGVVPVAPPAGGRRSLADLSVNIKILAAVGLAAVIALLVGLLGLSALGATSDSAQLIYRSNVASIKAIGVVDGAMTQVRSDAANQALSLDAAATTRFTEAVTAGLEEVEAGLTAYRQSNPAGDPAVIDDLAAKWQAYADLLESKQLPAGHRNDLAAWAKTRDTQVLPLIGTVNKNLATLTASEDADAARNGGGGAVDLRFQPHPVDPAARGGPGAGSGAGGVRGPVHRAVVAQGEGRV